MSSEISKAIQALCAEKNLSLEVVMETIETALAAAYRKDFGNKQQNIKVKFDPETAGIKVWDVKTVVEDIEETALEAAQEELAARREKARTEGRELTEEETADLPRFNPKTELMLKDAKAIQKKLHPVKSGKAGSPSAKFNRVKIGDVLEIPLEVPGEFGRMAAQTAKQVIIQKIREAERNMVFDDYKDYEGKIITGTIQRVEGRKVLVDLGRGTGLLPSDLQVSRDHYRPGSRMKFYVASVAMSVRGPEIILSRSDIGMVREIFKQEIPEISDGVILIKGVARDAGARSKISVFTEDSSVDPIGSCIGQRGGRINTIIEELNGEKIDVIRYSEDTADYISHALSPAKISRVEIVSPEEKTAEVYVPAEQFSLAIGRGGQNVRLASQLTGWKIKVIEEGGSKEISSEEVAGEEIPVEESKETVEPVKE